MATYYSRKKSPYYYICYIDPSTGKVMRESTAKFVRINGTVTPARKDTKEGKKTAQEICDEIDAAKKLGMVSSVFTKPKLSVSIETAFDKFISLNRKKAKNTIYQHKRFYELFQKTFPAKSPVHTLTKENVEEWLLSLDDLYFIRKKKKDDKFIYEKKEYSQNSKLNFQKSLIKFLNYLFEYKYIEYFRINKDVKVRPEQKENIIFTVKDMHTIIDNLDKKNSNLRTLVYLLLYTGLRSSEVLSFHVEKIDLDRETVNYYSLKANKWITIPLHPELIPHLKKRIAKVKSGKLLAYNDHHAVNRAINRYLKEIGLDGKGYSARTFRKTFDSWSFANDMNVIANSRLVGHSVITAEKHYRVVEVEKLRNELKKFKIPGKK